MLTDKNGKNAESLRDKKLYLLDMDGTIYNEDEIFEGTLDFLDEIERRGGQYIAYFRDIVEPDFPAYLTNDTTDNQYQENDAPSYFLLRNLHFSDFKNW